MFKVLIGEFEQPIRSREINVTTRIGCNPADKSKSIKSKVSTVDTKI